MPLGNGLESDGQGSVQTSGSEPSAPTAYLYGANGFVGVGAGLQIGANGEFETSSAYIYCTPQFSHLPVTYPPYGCETAVNTAGVTDFTDAWRECEAITEFPCVDSSAVTDFSYAWYGCYGLTSFPALNTSSGEDFTYSWAYTGLTNFPKLNTSNGLIFYATWCGCYNLASFPLLDVSSGTNFEYTWYGCASLTSFPSLDLSSGEDFNYTWLECFDLASFPALDLSSGTTFIQSWFNCTSLTSFPAEMFDNCLATEFQGAWYNCALSQQSVDNILVSLDTAGQSNGIVNVDGGTSAAPGAAGLAAKTSLEGKGWTVIVNAESLSHGASLVKAKRRKTNKRTRDKKGQFLGDIPGTPENEAWIYVSEVSSDGK
jgi:hypothetical protein